MEFPNKELFELTIAVLMRVHYRLMERAEFWYNAELREIDARLCLEASNLRLQLKKATEDWDKVVNVRR